VADTFLRAARSKILLAALASLAAGTCWNFTSDEFHEKKHNSFQLPIFVVSYSHCSGLPEGIVQYSDSDVLVTMVYCGHFHIST
jgi:hypothetical protein